MTGLRAQGLVAGYGPEAVLRGVDLAVPQGGLLAVLGPSGCGKTTLLRVLAGFHPVRAGRVMLGDRVLAAPGTHVPPERRGIGIVPQEGALFPHLSVAGNVGFGLRRTRRGVGGGGRDGERAGGDRGARRRRVGELLELVGLAGFERRLPAQLSGGQRQRVALARALAPRPGVVLMDEPFSSLDASLRDELRADVRAALRAFGATAVLVTHDQEEALGIADLVAVLRDGVVAQLGAPQEIYTRPADLGVALFVGEAAAFEGTARDGAADTPLGRLPLSGSGAGTVLVRPEQLLIGNGNGTVPGTTGPVAATVHDVLFHGHDTTVLLRLPDGTLVRSRVQGPPPVRPGDAVALTVTGPALFFPSPPPSPPSVPPPSPPPGAGRPSSNPAERGTPTQHAGRRGHAGHPA